MFVMGRSLFFIKHTMLLLLKKYIDSWTDEYDYVIETDYNGAGVAPWNISLYKFKGLKNNIIELYYKKSACELIFYHFEKIMYINHNKANIGLYDQWGVDSSLVSRLYPVYLKKLNFKKQMLKENYDIDYVQRVYPGMEKDKQLSAFQRTLHYLNIILNSSISELLYNRIPYLLLRRKNIISFIL